MTKLTRLTNQRLRPTKSVVGQAQHTFREWLHVHVLAVNVVLVAAVVSCGIGYLTMVNTTASDSFAMHELSRQVDDLKQSNSALQLSMSEVLSLQHISATSQDHSLVAATTVEYLPTDQAVAYSH